MTARLQKIGKKKGNFWMFGWWVWFFTHWSGSAAFVEKDEADSCHRWPQYNALPGRFKGCYSFRYPNKVQLRFWLIQNFVWKPNSREIDVPPLCEMSFIQPVRYQSSKFDEVNAPPRRFFWVSERRFFLGWWNLIEGPRTTPMGVASGPCRNRSRSYNVHDSWRPLDQAKVALPISGWS